MAKVYEAIEYFEDLQDERHPYKKDDVYPREGFKVSEERLAELSSSNNRRKRPMIREKKQESVEFPKHTGGGWYELSNGEKVQGKDEALEEQAKLD